MGIDAILRDIAKRHGVPVGFDDLKREPLSDDQKRAFRDNLANSLQPTFTGMPMPLSQVETQSGVACVAVQTLRGLIDEAELIPARLEIAMLDIVSGAARLPRIKFIGLENCIQVEQGRHRITGLHLLGFEFAEVSFLLDQADKMRTIFGDNFRIL
ncbi:hypothetical protein IP81_05265 [Novosphingobium sp. AAP83]|uniref:hypothetical protein n=1 Tax=Novosphingobium sp. AAP83 TaxID=1523425 RepID=UPI0006B94132|nr:hypothetical protein [Novosphingobium sp. AAP83]KPF92620.1 hypothetical protein IP81_05265 [Novosphingobium sp. AAP83]